MPLPENLLLGASSWTAPSWRGAFYPAELPEGEWLQWYAARFKTVEVDSTWYRSPSRHMVREWDRKTPEDFVIAAKVPRSITHEKILEDCEGELIEFCETMSLLGPKLGALLIQLPYFKKAVIPSLDAFLERLLPFLPLLPRDIPFALEIRNKPWLKPALFSALEEHRVTLAWIDHPWMPRAWEWAGIKGAVTTDWLYVRFLGDRHRIEAVTKEWDQIVVDRTREYDAWAGVLGQLTPVLGRVYAFYNNHYAGCSFKSIPLFEGAWAAREERRQAETSAT